MHRCNLCKKDFSRNDVLIRHQKTACSKSKDFQTVFPDSKATMFPNTTLEDEETVLSWKDLPSVWFRIVGQKDIRTKKGEFVKLLTLMSEDGAIRKAWTTTIIAYKIDEQRLHVSINFPAHLYIKSKGKTNSHLHLDRSYYNCTLRYC